MPWRDTAGSAAAPPRELTPRAVERQSQKARARKTEPKNQFLQSEIHAAVRATTPVQRHMPAVRPASRPRLIDRPARPPPFQAAVGRRPNARAAPRIFPSSTAQTPEQHRANAPVPARAPASKQHRVTCPRAAASAARCSPCCAELDPACRCRGGRSTESGRRGASAAPDPRAPPQTRERVDRCLDGHVPCASNTGADLPVCRNPTRSPGRCRETISSAL